MDGDFLRSVRVNLANDHSASPGDRIGVAHNRVAEHVEDGDGNYDRDPDCDTFMLNLAIHEPFVYNVIKISEWTITLGDD